MENEELRIKSEEVRVEGKEEGKVKVEVKVKIKEVARSLITFYTLPMIFSCLLSASSEFLLYCLLGQ
ncbi:MAG: hypothetical protein JSW70_06560 [Syntrophobacterales bacterium]|nr:MAG: hypothetical protein JSW70_06560 [Syntrophobacterales bacterium]